jgi:hypothetical protein
MATNRRSNNGERANDEYNAQPFDNAFGDEEDDATTTENGDDVNVNGEVGDLLPLIFGDNPEQKATRPPYSLLVFVINR